MSLIFYYIVAHSPGVVGIHGLRKGRKVVGLPCDFFFSLFVVQKIFFKPATIPSSSTPQKDGRQSSHPSGGDPQGLAEYTWLQSLHNSQQ
jgi:hypothetical protein